ncbi:MAG: slipin family protein [Chloroflexi bacterium]|nr:slipin family protein [Chloroflexota bacterium]MBL7062356.1 slipin family protein [Dehalococcoidia bacterium]
MNFILIAGIAIFVIIILAAAIRIVNEYERGVIFRLGRFVGVRGPGLVLLIPFIERMVKIDLRVVTMDVPTQECITMDTVTVKVDAVVYFRVMKPEDAVLNVEQYIRATSLLSQTTLRNVVGQSELEDLLARRDKINEKLQSLIDEGTEPWGIKVSMVEVRDVELPDSMQRAMAAQAEAERERRAKIVHAEGEFQAAQKLADAAKVISSQPAALQLRYLQTLTTISTERTNTIVFPLPIELIAPFLTKLSQAKK